MARTRLNPDKFCDKVSELVGFLEPRLIGQPRAIQRVAVAYNYFLSPIWLPERPIISLLGLGPSGAGKTFLAKLLAEFFLGARDAFTKVVCANYMESHELATLLGSPPGYVGYNDPRATDNPPLLHQMMIDRWARNYFVKSNQRALEMSRELEKLGEEQKRAYNAGNQDAYYEAYGKSTRLYYELESYINSAMPRPISIVLWDEIEKSHEAVRNALLEITGEGKTQLKNGEETKFFGSFNIMTSNVGSQAIADIVKGKETPGFHANGGRLENAEDSVYLRATEELERMFRPEFIGRIKEDVVVFRPLLEKEFVQILSAELDQFRTQLKGVFPLEIDVDDRVQKFVIDKATDHPQYGARLLKDKIKRYIIDPLAIMMNSKEVGTGDKVFVFLENEKIIFEKESGIVPVNIDIMPKAQDLTEAEAKVNKKKEKSK